MTMSPVVARLMVPVVPIWPAKTCGIPTPALGMLAMVAIAPPRLPEAPELALNKIVWVAETLSGSNETQVLVPTT
jgi:hypothetical protein